MKLFELKQRVREHSELALRIVAMEDVGRRYPGRVTTSALPRQNAFLRLVFVPLYRRVPWSYKHKAMHALKMTTQNWPEDARHFGEPWRPPAGTGAVPPEAPAARETSAGALRAEH
jgi:hypothetical protein